MQPAPSTMSMTDFKALSDLVRAYCGFHMREEFRFVIERKLSARLAGVGATTFSGYAHYLRTHALGSLELESAVDSIIPLETWFFRQRSQLDVLRDEIIPAWQASEPPTPTMRVWSAACATGEEAYSIAMSLMSAGSLNRTACEVIGTDLSERAITWARSATYGERSLQDATLFEKKTYFDGDATKGWTVKDAFRRCVNFTHYNLIGDERWPFPPVDVVVCRNTLMYFDEETRQRVLERLFQALAPGGYLLLGHAEQLISAATNFEVVQLQGEFVYQRPRR